MNDEIAAFREQADFPLRAAATIVLHISLPQPQACQRLHLVHVWDIHMMQNELWIHFSAQLFARSVMLHLTLLFGNGYWSDSPLLLVH